MSEKNFLNPEETPNKEILQQRILDRVDRLRRVTDDGLITEHQQLSLEDLQNPDIEGVIIALSHRDIPSIERQLFAEFDESFIKHKLDLLFQKTYDDLMKEVKSKLN